MHAALAGYVEKLKADGDVSGVVLFGSWARGNNRPDSDFDLMIVTKGTVRRGIETADGANFELVLTTEEAAKDYWRHNVDDCAELWRCAKVLFDRDGTVARLRAHAEALLATPAPEMAPEAVKHLKFDAEDTLRAVAAMEHSDPLTAKLLLHQKFFELTELYFKIRRERVPPPKQRISVFKEKFIEIYGIIVGFYSSTLFEDEFKLVRRMKDRVFEGAGLER